MADPFGTTIPGAGSVPITTPAAALARRLGNGVAHQEPSIGRRHARGRCGVPRHCGDGDRRQPRRDGGRDHRILSHFRAPSWGLTSHRVHGRAALFRNHGVAQVMGSQGRLRGGQELAGYIRCRLRFGRGLVGHRRSRPTRTRRSGTTTARQSDPDNQHHGQGTPKRFTTGPLPKRWSAIELAGAGRASRVGTPLLTSGTPSSLLDAPGQAQVGPRTPRFLGRNSPRAAPKCAAIYAELRVPPTEGSTGCGLQRSAPWPRPPRKTGLSAYGGDPSPPDHHHRRGSGGEGAEQAPGDPDPGGPSPAEGTARPEADLRSDVPSHRHRHRRQVAAAPHHLQPLEDGSSAPRPGLTTGGTKPCRPQPRAPTASAQAHPSEDRYEATGGAPIGGGRQTGASLESHLVTALGCLREAP